MILWCANLLAEFDLTDDEHMFLGFELHALVVLTRSGSKLTILGRFVNIFF